MGPNIAHCSMQTEDPKINLQPEPNSFILPTEKFLQFKVLQEPEGDRIAKLPPQACDVVPNTDWAETNMYLAVEARAQNRQVDPEHELSADVLSPVETEYWVEYLEKYALREFKHKQ